MKLKAKLIITFLVIGLGTLIFITLWYSLHAREMVQESKAEHLKSVSDLQVEKLNTIIAKSNERLNAVANRMEFRFKLMEMMERERFFEDIMGMELRNAMAPFYPFIQAQVVDTAGMVVASVDPLLLGQDYSKKDFFLKAKAGNNTLNQFFLDEFKQPRIILSSPLFREGDLFGVLVIESTIEPLARLTAIYTGLGETGETILVKRDDKGDAMLIAPARFEPDGALRRIIPKEEEEIVANKVLQLKSDTFFTQILDYRFKPVYASAHYLEEFDWALITKIDRAEALLPVQNIQYMLMITFIIAGLITTGVIIFVANRMVRPVKGIIAGIQRVEHHDYTQKIKTSSKDEFGIMATAFNQMTKRLHEKSTELRRRMIQLEAVNQELEQFAYVVSHDLKAPLNGMSALTDLLIEEHMDQMGKEGVRQLKMMKEQAEKMNQLIFSILEYSRIGRIREQLQQVNLNKVVEEVLFILQPPPHIDIEIEKPLPVILGQQIPFQQIFQNLLSNAIRYINKPKGKIRIGFEEDESSWEFFVAYNGIGIEEKYLKKIFEIFRTLNKGKSLESTGVGLAIVKKHIQGMGGEIWVESTPNKGSTFFFRIPKTAGE